MEKLTEESLRANLAGLEQRDAILSMPKFKIETPEIDMIHPMIKLGLVDVFGDDANLSGMNGKEDLYVSTLVQKAYIDVNEAGSEAAAVTIAVVAPKGAPSNQEPIEMSFDHPFLFVIRDTNTGTILFIGQLMQP
jgi:serpin B